MEVGINVLINIFWRCNKLNKGLTLIPPFDFLNFTLTEGNYTRKTIYCICGKNANASFQQTICNNFC